jgi:hypothetical protein
VDSDDELIWQEGMLFVNDIRIILFINFEQITEELYSFFSHKFLKHVHV